MQILIIDDSATARLAVKKLLIGLFPEAVFAQAHGGILAQSLFEACPPDLVVCDLEMREGEGGDFVRWMRGQLGHAQTPVLVYTGKEDTGRRLRLLAYQPIAFLTKPAPVQAWAETLESLFQGPPQGLQSAA